MILRTVDGKDFDGRITAFRRAAADRCEATRIIGREEHGLARAVRRMNGGGWRMSQFDPAMLHAPGSLFVAVGRDDAGRLSIRDVDGAIEGVRVAAATASDVCRVAWGAFLLPIGGPLIGAHPSLRRLAMLATEVFHRSVQEVDFDAWAAACDDLAEADATMARLRRGEEGGRTAPAVDGRRLAA